MYSRPRLDSIYTVFIVFSISILTLGISYLAIFTASYRAINKVTQSFARQYADSPTFFEKFSKELSQVEAQYAKAETGYFFPNGQPLGQTKNIPLANRIYIEWHDFLQARWLKSITYYHKQ